MQKVGFCEKSFLKIIFSNGFEKIKIINLNKNEKIKKI